MNAKKKKVEVKVIEDKPVPITKNLRSKENENVGIFDVETGKKYHFRNTLLKLLNRTVSDVTSKKKNKENPSENHADIDGVNVKDMDSTASTVLYSEKKSKSKGLKDKPDSQLKTEMPNKKRSMRLRSIQNDCEDAKVKKIESVTNNFFEISRPITRRKSQRLTDQSHANAKIPYSESEDSFEESQSRKSVVLEKNMLEIRKSLRSSSIASHKSIDAHVRGTSSSPQLKNRTKAIKTPESNRSIPALPASRTPSKSSAKQKARNATPIRNPTPLCATPKSTKCLSGQSNGSSMISRRILRTPESKSRKTSTITPSSARKRIPKTPTTVRRRLGYELRARIQSIEHENNSTSDDESDEYKESLSDSDESEFVKTNAERKITRVKSPSLTGEDSDETRIVTLSRRKLRFDYNFTLNADDYFISKSSNIPTSDNKLSMIETPQLVEEEMKTILSTSYTKHKLQLDSLILQYENSFRKWLFYLEEGFNLLMYGLGSKIDLLKDFHRRMLHNYHVVTIHGYFPGLTIKNILGSLFINILKQEKYPNEMNEALSLINDLTRTKKCKVFIIIHNIDGAVLRENKYQQMFAKLASFRYIHLIASIDHINAPLLWGNSKMSQFNFVWLDVTTYKPYINEISFEDALHLTESDSEYVSLSSLREIFRPLVQKVKKIFQIIAKDRLDNKNNKNYKGISMTDWYRKARSAFLVNNKNTFRVMLTELVDHKIITLNNEECIPLRIKLNDLEVFYEQQFGDEN